MSGYWQITSDLQREYREMYTDDTFCQANCYNCQWRGLTVQKWTADADHKRKLKVSTAGKNKTWIYGC